MWCLKYKRELALSLMISACLSSSVLAQGASDSFATAAQKSLPKTIASKSKAALNISDSSTPEAGVQVLTEILHLLESKGTLVAMKPQMVASADLPNSAPNMFQQQLMNSPRQSDPANLIRPPAKKSAAKSSSMVAGKLLSRPSSAAGGAPLIAMNNKQSSEFSKAGF